MGRNVETKVVLDPETDLDLKKWADEAERSKRRQIAILLRRLTTLRRTNPQDLQRLQLAN